MPETYKWVYRRPHGILGLANTYGFVSYCTYDPEDSSLFVAVPRKDFLEQLDLGSFSVALHHSETNTFSLGGQEIREGIQKRAAERNDYSILQPGRFDPTFAGVDQLLDSSP